MFMREQYLKTLKPNNTSKQEENTMKYINKRNGKVTANVTFDEKFKTYALEFVDGTSTVVTVSTFKRWYAPFESPEVVEPVMDLDNPLTEEEAKELGRVTGDEALENAVVDPDTCGDGTPLTEVGKEIAEQAKAKAKKVKKDCKVKETAEWVTKAEEYVYGLVTAQGDEVFVPNNINMRSFKVGGHMYAKFNFSKSSISLAVKSSSIEAGVKACDRTLNHMFDAVYNFKAELTEQDKELIIKLLAGARAQRVSKNQSK